MGNIFQEYIKASESVTKGHPDVICNLIAANILDACIVAGKHLNAKPKVALEVTVKGTEKGGKVLIVGEVTVPEGVIIPYEQIARNTIQAIGYTNPEYGFHYELVDVEIIISEQSIDIARGVNQKRTGAGDQGIMFGGAVSGEGPEYMPLPIMLAHGLTRRYTQLFESGNHSYLRPDGKAQVVIQYKDGKPEKVVHVTVAASHEPTLSLLDVRQFVLENIIQPVLDEFGYALPDTDHVVINGGGAWIIPGPLSDAGTTGRKIIVDSYGGAFPHGGGNFNGKDPTKVDVTGAVAARYLAKELVARKLATKVQVDVCYALGIPHPLGVTIETFGTNRVSESVIREQASSIIDLSVDGILTTIDMYQPIYGQAAAGGWFGRPEFPWEQTPTR